MSTERGLMIQETVRAMGQEKYLRQLAQQRDRRMAQKKRKQKKEADTAGVLSQHAGDVLVTEVCEMREHFTVKEKPVEGFDLGITVTTSSDINNVKKPLNNYTIESVGLSRKQSGELFLKPNGEMREHFGIKESQSDSTYSNQGSFGYAQDDQEGEVIPDVCREPNTSGDYPDGAFRQQGCSELPVHLL